MAPRYRTRGRTARRWDGLGTLLVLLVLAGGLVLRESHRPREVVTGPARVIDGDSLRVDGHEIRLAGIDAPELHQTCRRAGLPYACGADARAALRGLTRNGAVTCDLLGHDRYGRDLARCTAGSTDLGAWLVTQGYAVAYGSYADEEEQARRAGAGIWAGTFDLPSEWRKAHPRAREHAETGRWADR
jgi:endonuclease YncB( thermonuclease family)